MKHAMLVLLVVYGFSFNTSYAKEKAELLLSPDDIRFQATARESGTDNKVLTGFTFNIDRLKTTFRWEDGPASQAPVLLMKLRARVPTNIQTIRHNNIDIEPDYDGSFIFETRITDRKFTVKLDCIPKDTKPVSVELNIRVQPSKTIFYSNASCKEHLLMLEEQARKLDYGFIVSAACEATALIDKMYIYLSVLDAEFISYHGDKLTKNPQGIFRLVANRLPLKTKEENINFITYEGAVKTGKFKLAYTGIDTSIGYSRRDFNIGIGFFWQAGTGTYGTKATKLAGPGAEFRFEAFLLPAFSFGGVHARAFPSGNGRFGRDAVSSSYILLSLYPFAESGENSAPSGAATQFLGRIVKLFSVSAGLGLSDVSGLSNSTGGLQNMTMITIPLFVGTELVHLGGGESFKIEFGYIPSFIYGGSMYQVPLRMLIQKKF